MASAIQTETDSTTELCTKCGQARDTIGYPKWCKACRSTYKREYAELKEGMSETRGYSAGISAMRDCAAREFDRLGSGSFAAFEVAALIRQMPGPERPA